MGRHGDQTREQLLDAAEHLFSEEGVARVSMRQIRIAAGQRNEGAVQYHFGDLTGVLLGLLKRHGPQILQIQERIVAANGSRPSLRKQIDAMARPIAEYATLGSSERAWVKVLDDLVSDPSLSFAMLTDGSPSLSTEVAMSVYEQLSKRVSPELAGERIWAVAQFVIHITADRARLVDAASAGREAHLDDAFVDNVVAMAYGALTAAEP